MDRKLDYFYYFCVFLCCWLTFWRTECERTSLLDPGFFLWLVTFSIQRLTYTWSDPGNLKHDDGGFHSSPGLEENVLLVLAEWQKNLKSAESLTASVREGFGHAVKCNDPRARVIIMPSTRSSYTINQNQFSCIFTVLSTLLRRVSGCGHCWHLTVLIYSLQIFHIGTQIL